MALAMKNLKGMNGQDSAHQILKPEDDASNNQTKSAFDVKSSHFIID